MNSFDHGSARASARSSKDPKDTSDRYRQLFQDMPNGFCVLQLIFDGQGRPRDFRYVETNPAFQTQTGITSALGKTVRELVPDIEEFWIETYGKVALTGEPVRLRDHSAAMGRSFKVLAFPFGAREEGQVAVLFEEVTESLQIETVLDDSEARFRLMAEAIPQIVWIADAAGNVDFFNKKWTDYTGAPAVPTPASHIAEVHIHPDDVPGTFARFNEACATGTGFQLEHRIRGGDGTYRWFLVRGEPSRSPATGEITHWFGASTDIHDRKEAEAALARGEEQLRLIVESASDYAIFMADIDDRIVNWWLGAERVFGWPAAEIVGEQAAILYTEEDIAAGVPSWEVETAKAEGQAPNVRWHRRKDGTRVFIEGSRVALRDPEGQQVGFLKIGQDVTERHKAEAALRESEERFRQFGEASSDLLWIMDAAATRFEYLSPASASLLGLDHEDLARADNGSDWINLMEPEDRARVRAHLDRIQSGIRSECEYRIHRASDGEPRWLRDTGFPLLDAEGALARVAGITTDVTVEKDTRERLKVLVTELQHRTRNLLAVVQALAERTLTSSESLNDFRERFYPRLSALARVNELLSRLGTDERVTFDQLVHAELNAHGALSHEQRDGRIVIEGPSNIRLRSSTIQTLALAIHELCTNSLKYGALSQPEARLSLRWQEEHGTAGERRLTFVWDESNVAMNRDPGAIKRGFGRELIERALPRQLKTDVEYIIGAEGVRCTVSLPLSTHPAG